jgi:hypothetical protein
VIRGANGAPPPRNAAACQRNWAEFGRGHHDAAGFTGNLGLFEVPKTVAVQTGGGSETGAMDSSNITDEDLKAAIEESIKNSRVFRSIVQGKDSDYELAVSIVQLDKPVFGLSFSVNMEASWVLVKQSDRSVAMKTSIRSSHTATFGDAAVGVTRLRLAVEGAARKNIEQGLQAISALTL